VPQLCRVGITLKRYSELVREAPRRDGHPVPPGNGRAMIQRNRADLDLKDGGV
jgi:hypothetical protein